MYPKLDLPPSATVEEVLDRMLQMVSFENGRVTEFRVMELRGVMIGLHSPERYNVANVDTNLEGRRRSSFSAGNGWTGGPESMT